MNRRQFALASLITAGLTGCESEPKPARTATLLHHQDIHQAFLDLEKSVESLEVFVGDFGSENWNEVVPKVRTAALSVVDTLAELKRVLGYGLPKG